MILASLYHHMNKRQSMHSCARLVSTLVNGSLDPFLRTHGFSKKKHTWNRPFGSFVDVLDVQESQWNDADSCSITVNVGVFSGEIHEICWGKPAPSWISEVD